MSTRTLLRCLAVLLAADPFAAGLRKGRTASPAFDKALLMGTHNSYEKKPLGIVQQLDLGVRLLELDLYIYDFEARREYCVGHDRCFDGDTQNGTLGNPSTHFLNAWLQQIRTWSLNHPDHAPISLMLDMKSDFVGGGKTHDQGGLSNLQDTLQNIFGDSLYWKSSKPAGAWPSIDQMLGKVLVVLSGHREGRILYQQHPGTSPRAVVNQGGSVVEVHSDSWRRSLYYWTGRRSGDSVTWLRHGRFDSGRDSWPAIEGNAFVEVHKSQNYDDLWYNVGVLDPATLEIQWGSPVKYDRGVSPTCVLAGGLVQERHQSQSTGKVWVRSGTLDVANRRINWHSDAVQQDVPLFSLPGEIEAAELGGLLHYRVQGQQSFQKIQYSQMMFVDWQPGCSGGGENYAPLNTSPFQGVSRTCSSPKSIDGVATRVWSYSLDDARGGKNPGSIPATDEPSAEFKAWVLSNANGIGY